MGAIDMLLSILVSIINIILGVFALLFDFTPETSGTSAVVDIVQALQTCRAETSLLELVYRAAGADLTRFVGLALVLWGSLSAITPWVVRFSGLFEAIVGGIFDTVASHKRRPGAGGAGRGMGGDQWVSRFGLPLGQALVLVLVGAVVLALPNEAVAVVFEVVSRLAMVVATAGAAVAQAVIGAVASGLGVSVPPVCGG